MLARLRKHAGSLVQQTLVGLLAALVIASLQPWFVPPPADAVEARPVETEPFEDPLPSVASVVAVTYEDLRPHLEEAEVAAEPPFSPPAGALARPVASEEMDGWLVVLSDQFTWMRGSDASVGIEDSARTPEEVRTHLAELGDEMRRASDIIAVGMASVAGSPAEEEARADARAGQLAQWLQEARPDDYWPTFWKLSLGQYRGVEEDSPDQRRVMVLMVTPRRSVDLAPATLRRALAETANLDLDLAAFSKFELRRLGGRAPLTAAASP